MKKVLDFLAKPRNMIFSLLVMFALVVGLLKVSFSYYVEDSTNSAQLKLDTIDNRLNSNDLNNRNNTKNQQQQQNKKIYKSPEISIGSQEYYM